MTTSTLQQLKEKIIEAVPDVLSDCMICGAQMGKGEECISNDSKHVVTPRSIQLADAIVLLKKRGYNSTEEWHQVLGELVDRWDPRRDLDGQSQITHEFLLSVLS